MSELPEYNGWANYPTWNVHLWLTNDAALCEDARRVARDHGERELREFVERLIWPGELYTGLAADLLGWTLDHVVWSDIVAALQEE